MQGKVLSRKIKGTNDRAKRENGMLGLCIEIRELPEDFSLVLVDFLFSCESFELVMSDFVFFSRYAVRSFSVIRYYANPKRLFISWMSFVALKITVTLPFLQEGR